MVSSQGDLASGRALFHDALHFMELGQALPQGRGVDAERWRYFRTAILLALACVERQVRLLAQEAGQGPPGGSDVWHWLLQSDHDPPLRQAVSGAGGLALSRLMQLRLLLVAGPVPASAAAPAGLDPAAAEAEERARRAIADTRRLVERLAAAAGTAEAVAWVQAESAGPAS